MPNELTITLPTLTAAQARELTHTIASAVSPDSGCYLAAHRICDALEDLADQLDPVAQADGLATYLRANPDAKIVRVG